jgi:ATP-dependent DNA helicase RecQ
LSTWGILKEHARSNIRDWIEQLVGQEFLVKAGEYQQLTVTDLGRRVLRGEETPILMQAANPSSGQTDVGFTPTSLLDSWEGVDRGLFESLRTLRRNLAAKAGLPPYIVFGDTTLRDMARLRPSSQEHFLAVHGVGLKKVASYGEMFLQHIGDYCRQHQLPQDVVLPSQASHPASFGQLPSVLPDSHRAASQAAVRAFPYFREGMQLSQIAERLSRAESTVQDYLVEYILSEKILDASAWVQPADIARIEIAAEYAELDNPQPLRLKPIHQALHGEIDYCKIKVVLTCRALRARELIQHD